MRAPSNVARPSQSHVIVISGLQTARAAPFRTHMNSLRIALLSFAMVSLFGCDKIEEELQCREVCVEIKACEASIVSVDACQDACFDRAEANDAFRNQVEDCANCLASEDYSCAEVEDLCPMCAAVSEILLPAE